MTEQHQSRILYACDVCETKFTRKTCKSKYKIKKQHAYNLVSTDPERHQTFTEVLINMFNNQTKRINFLKRINFFVLITAPKLSRIDNRIYIR